MDAADDANMVAGAATLTATGAQKGTDMVEFLKTEQYGCLDRGEFFDANAIQRIMLSCLEETRNNTGREMLATSNWQPRSDSW
eukprot:s2457_g8.t1